jgi:hypothetical protein
MTHHDSDKASQEELCDIVAKVFNLNHNEVKNNLDLFTRIDPVFRNCLFCLSKIENRDMKISASMSLEFLVHFKKSAF